MNITVKDIMDLLHTSNHLFNIRIFTLNTTFCFKDDEVPEEIYPIKVKSINNPEAEIGMPLCLNVYYGDFEDFDAFKHFYRNFIVK